MSLKARSNTAAIRPRDSTRGSRLPKVTEQIPEGQVTNKARTPRNKQAKVINREKNRRFNIPAGGIPWKIDQEVSTFEEVVTKLARTSRRQVFHCIYCKVKLYSYTTARDHFTSKKHSNKEDHFKAVRKAIVERLDQRTQLASQGHRRERILRQALDRSRN